MAEKALERVKIRLVDVAEQETDEYIQELIDTVSDRVALIIGATSLPDMAESIVVDAVVKMFNRKHYEGISSEGAGEGGSIDTSFVEKILGEYEAEFDGLRALVKDDQKTSRKKVRFL